MQPRHFIIAGNHRQAMDWAVENGLNPHDRRTVLCVCESFRLRGYRLDATDEVHWVGTWNDRRDAPEVRDLMRAMIAQRQHDLPGVVLELRQRCAELEARLAKITDELEDANDLQTIVIGGLRVDLSDAELTIDAQAALIGRMAEETAASSAWALHCAIVLGTAQGAADRIDELPVLSIGYAVVMDRADLLTKLARLRLALA